MKKHFSMFAVVIMVLMIAVTAAGCGSKNEKEAPSSASGSAASASVEAASSAEAPAPPEDFSGLKEFAAGLACDLLIVHCWEGKSRSAAVAKAVCRFMGLSCDLCSKEELSLNPLVYALACRELGI